MMERAILLTLLTLLAVIGIADILRAFSSWVLSGAGHQTLISIIPCKNNADDLEYIVKSTYFRLKQQNHCRHCRIILTNDGADEQTVKICERLSRENDCIILCKEDEIDTLLREKFHLQIQP